MKEWDSLKFDPSEFRRKPSPEIYLFSMPANRLRALSGVFRRSRSKGEATGIQRGHDQKRSEQIRDFVRYGYPYSEMSEARRKSFDSDDLRKPGWLPTAIVVNILTAQDTRRGKKVTNGDLIVVESQTNEFATLNLPKGFSKASWEPSGLPPLEIIDGQHRLFAFEPDELPGEFELPVVAFHGLDIGWQAYLFWSINVSPKKINPSHAFDLYPLLRSQDWLEKFAESNVYREARAQELTEFLYRFPGSPWEQRINMLGERGVKGVSQAGWVRALGSTYLATGRGRGAKGLFGCSISDVVGPLPWTRAQQAAFLIHLWDRCAFHVRENESQWATGLREAAKNQTALGIDEKTDLAFAGPATMLNQEQGVRGLLSISNDIFFHSAEELGLADWEPTDDRGTSTDDQEIRNSLRQLRKQDFSAAIDGVAKELAQFDWRSADAPNLSDQEKLLRRAFRGSGGYAALRDELMKKLRQPQSSVAHLVDKVAQYRK